MGGRTATQERRQASHYEFQPHRNYLYEDLFGLPGNAHTFVRTYFLRAALRYAVLNGAIREEPMDLEMKRVLFPGKSRHAF